jgi:hypothetical protein
MKVSQSKRPAKKITVGSGFNNVIDISYKSKKLYENDAHMF